MRIVLRIFLYNVVQMAAKVAIFSPRPPWDADSACANAPFNCSHQTNAWSTLYGQNTISVPGSNNPSNSGTNGPGNTYLISLTLNEANGNTNTAPATYAAGACVSYNEGGHTDWYLPAICEMSYFAQGDNSANCGSEVTPLLQNMQSNLIDIDSASSVASGLYSGGNAGNYWSSTEYSGGPLVHAWNQGFASSGSSSLQYHSGKYLSLGVRCARGFTN